MSTRCRIAFEHDDKFESIYCHHDGYLSWVGRKLQEHYRTPEDVRALMDLGDISSLGDQPTPVKDFGAEDREYKYCRPYSLRGEDCPSTFDSSLRALKERTEDCWGEYLYVFMKDYNGIYKWYVWELSDYRRLEDELKALEKGEELHNVV